MRTVRMLIGVCLFFFSIVQVFAQEKSKKVILKTDFEIQKHTVMEQFEPGYIISVEKRAELKIKRIADAEYTLNILDTMKISNRKRKQLLRDLKYSPYSNRLNKFIVETKLDDEDMASQ